MNLFLTLALAFAWLVILTGGWLGWQLLRQNGRILLRLDELEKRLDEWEFSGTDEPPATPQIATNDDDRASRFKNRSLTRSKLQRDGLEAGTPAPNFRLPRLDGRGDLTLSELRGRGVLLVFSDPHCGPCNALAPELERFYRESGGRKRSPSPRPSPPREGELASAVEVVMISKGEPKENRAKVKEHGLTFPVVLQQQWEISRRYAMFATPIAYLIDEAGVIIHDVAVGTDAIQALLSEAGAPAPTTDHHADRN